MSYAEVCAILVRHPFNLTLEEIGKLDRWTVRNVYLRPRKIDSDGKETLLR